MVSFDRIGLVRRWALASLFRNKLSLVKYNYLEQLPFGNTLVFIQPDGAKLEASASGWTYYFDKNFLY